MYSNLNLFCFRSYPWVNWVSTQCQNQNFFPQLHYLPEQNIKSLVTLLMFDLVCLSITFKKLITFFILKANPKRGMMFSIVSLLHLNFQKVVLNELQNPVLAFSLILQTVTNAQLRIRRRCSKCGQRAYWGWLGS